MNFSRLAQTVSAALLAVGLLASVGAAAESASAGSTIPLTGTVTTNDTGWG